MLEKLRERTAGVSLEPVGRVADDLSRAVAAAAEIAASRERVRSGLLGRERVVTLALAGAFLLAAVGCAIAVPSESSFSIWVALLLVAVYAVLAQVEFEVGPGSAVPTELALVPMLFLLPPGSVPLCVAVGLLTAGYVERLRSHRHGDRVAVLVSSAWHSVGPALVIGFLAPGPPSWEHAPIYLLALLAQFAFDTGSVAVRHHLGRGVRVLDLAPALGWVALVDCALAPVAFAVAVAAEVSPAAVLCVVPLGGLLGALGAERRRRIDQSLAFGQVVEDATREARSDPLTGVGNRLAWQEAVALAESRLVKDGADVSVILVDLDRLKETNDTHGHDVGDRMIRAMASALQAAVPHARGLARVGGDEFALLTDANEDGLDAVVSMIRSELAQWRVGDLAISASVGAAACPPCATVLEAVAVADERLYDDKSVTKSRDP